jgi:hypothetical protein
MSKLMLKLLHFVYKYQDKSEDVYRTSPVQHTVGFVYFIFILGAET